MDQRAYVIEQLEKLAKRSDWGKKLTWPPQGESSVTNALAGVFLQTHYGMIIEALRRMD